MANRNSTPTDNSTADELAKQFPCNAEPFAIWYSIDVGDRNGCWAINDETGEAVYETVSYEAAVKLSRALIVSLGKEVEARLLMMTEKDIPFNGETVIRSASGGALYALANGAKRDDIQSTLSAKLAQLKAMLCITYGCGAGTFQNLSVDIQENYMWACADLAAECRALASL
jgi:hypothetical protein